MPSLATLAAPAPALTSAGFLIGFGALGGNGPSCTPATVHEEEEGDVDKEIFSEQTQIERKIFSFELRENPRGRFLKITEDVGGRRDTIIIPDTGLEQMRAIIERAMGASQKAGAAAPAQESVGG
jgi:hypothetical protein